MTIARTVSDVTKCPMKMVVVMNTQRVESPRSLYNSLAITSSVSQPKLDKNVVLFLSFTCGIASDTERLLLTATYSET